MSFSRIPARTQPWTETGNGKATDAKRRGERERGDAGESEKSTSSHTETINKPSSSVYFLWAGPDNSIVPELPACSPGIVLGVM